MTKILLLSDTHSYIDNDILKYVKQADEVWHAGDIGDISVSDTIKELKTLRAVYGNIDSKTIRAEFPLDLRFQVEGMTIFMTHIGGYPNKYYARVKEELANNNTDLYICGHSHILKVIPDKKLNLLHMNPGAAGKNGFHKVRTMLRFIIEGSNIKDLEVIEFSKR